MGVPLPLDHPAREGLGGIAQGFSRGIYTDRNAPRSSRGGTGASHHGLSMQQQQQQQQRGGRADMMGAAAHGRPDEHQQWRPDDHKVRHCILQRVSLLSTLCASSHVCTVLYGYGCFTVSTACTISLQQLCVKITTQYLEKCTSARYCSAHANAYLTLIRVINMCNHV
jgi:hypothetical protein